MTRERVAVALRRVRMSLLLLTERRVALYIAIDAVVVLAAVVRGFSGGGAAPSFYPVLVLTPLLAIALPMMADCVAVERRAGTLDLALTSPGSALYFERRIAGVALLAIGQAWLSLAVPWLLVEHFPLSGPMIQIVVVTAFVSAAALNWAVRLRSPGAVVFLTLLTCLAFAPWFFSNPVRPIDVTHGPMAFTDYVDFIRRNAVLALAAMALHVYARQRLARPETLVT
jgi:hypothetical protein